MQTAAERVEAILQYWESQLGHYLPRPVVIAGNLHQSGLAISDQDQAWLSQHCDAVLHVAASINFFGDQRSGEPFLSNVEGTKHLLQVCQQVGIQKFHHVSTAYIGGRIKGSALEAPVSIENADFRTLYEQSKAEAESLVEAAHFSYRPTFFRPSIIVGDSQTGFSPAYQSIYTALRLGYLHLLANLRQGWELDSDYARQVVREQFVDQLGLSGAERKNLVTVDWVAAAIVHCLKNTPLHGQIYNLANPHSTSVEAMSEAMVEAVLSCWQQKQATAGAISDELLKSDGFREQMSRYQVYFETDPEFDLSNTEGALAGKLACPELDHQSLVRLWTAAVKADFVWRPALPTQPKTFATKQLELLEKNDAFSTDLQLVLSGPGGGSWQISFLHEIPTGAVACFEPPLRQTAYLSGETLANLLSEQISLEQSLGSGLTIVPAGQLGAQVKQHLIRLLEWLRREETSGVQSEVGKPANRDSANPFVSTLQDSSTHVPSAPSKPSA